MLQIFSEYHSKFFEIKSKITKKLKSSSVKVIIYVLISSFSTALLLSLAKIITQDISANLVILLYKTIVIIAIIPWIFKDGLTAISTKKLHLYIFASIFSTLGSICLITSLKYVPLVNATCLGYLEKVILTIIGICFFKENNNYIKNFAISLSFLGAIIAIISDTNFSTQWNKYYILNFLSIIFWVIYCVILKIMGNTENNKTQLFYNTLFSILISALTTTISVNIFNTLNIQFNNPIKIVDISNFKFSFQDFIIISLMAICFLSRSIFSFKAFKKSDLSVIMPFGYSKIIFSGFLGFIFFGQIPTITSYIGYSLIILAGYLLFKEEIKIK
jgi:drug/metabolite transporter (DMT)-like permease